eukprot:1148923-Pelagomonas_calceolata.AAC.1
MHWPPLFSDASCSCGRFAPPQRSSSPAALLWSLPNAVKGRKQCNNTLRQHMPLHPAMCGFLRVPCILSQQCRHMPYAPQVPVYTFAPFPTGSVYLNAHFLKLTSHASCLICARRPVRPGACLTSPPTDPLPCNLACPGAEQPALQEACLPSAHPLPLILIVQVPNNLHCKKPACHQHTPCLSS